MRWLMCQGQHDECVHVWQGEWRVVLDFDRVGSSFGYRFTTYPQTNEGGVLHGFRGGYVYYGSIYIVKRGSFAWFQVGVRLIRGFICSGIRGTVQAPLAHRAAGH